MSRFGRVDILVNNAGVSKPGELLTYSPEDWHEVYETNVAACFFLSQVVLPTMKRQSWGRIIKHIIGLRHSFFWRKHGVLRRQFGRSKRR